MAAIPERDDGMATVEFAVVLIGIVFVLLFVLAGVGVALAEVRVHEAARAGARSAARGDPNSAVKAAATRSAPGSRVAVTRTGNRVSVSARMRPKVLPGLEIPSITVEATSVADAEGR